MILGEYATEELAEDANGGDATSEVVPYPMGNVEEQFEVSSGYRNH